MILIKPKSIVLDSSTIAADSDGYAEYNAGTTYAINSMVMVTTTTPNKIYKSLQNANIGKAPATETAWWQDQGGTNRWKMFDEFLDTQSSAVDSIVVEIDASNCDKFFLFNMDAYSVDIELTDNGTSTIVQTASHDLSNDDGYNESLIGNLYIYANSTLKITFAKTGGTAKCGVCGVGLSSEIGKAQWDVKSGIIDYSIKTTGGSGTYLSQGSWAKELDVKAFLTNGQVDPVYETLIAARGMLVVLDGNGDATSYDPLRVYGFLRDWNIKIDGPNHAWLDINMQGVI